MPDRPSHPRIVRQLTLAYAPAWAGTALAHLAGWAPVWLAAGVTLLSLPLGAAWLRWARSASAPPLALAVMASVLYLAGWHAAVIWADLLGLSGVRGSLAGAGTFGLFFLGLGWIVWALEGRSQQLERARWEQRRGWERPWNPLDPAAWYYGRKSPKLAQSTLALISYASLFWLITLLVSQVQGCKQI
jgi:hypothetical protein